MSLSVLPLLSEDDFPKFQRIIAELRHTTYDEWCRDHQQAIAYRIPRNGFREIPISAEEFDAWLEARSEAAHLELLWVCAEDKAAGPPQMVRQKSAI